MTLLFVTSFFNLLYECSFLCALMAKHTHHIFFTYETRSHVVYQSTAGTPIVHIILYEHSYKQVTPIEPPPPSPSTCRLCACSSRTLFRPQPSGDGTRMPSVLGESRASCRLPMNSWAGPNLKTTTEARARV